MNEPRLFRPSLRAYYKAATAAGVIGLLTNFFYPVEYAYAATVMATLVFFTVTQMRSLKVDENGITFHPLPRFDERRIDWALLDYSLVWQGMRGDLLELAIVTNGNAEPPHTGWRINLKSFSKEKIAELLAIPELRVSEVVDEATYIRRMRGE
ncbi:MAG: hypothetical protein PW788_09505 [Micavibrio sp.]|nr:hypothetical protein [Micavibrio sp.]